MVDCLYYSLHREYENVTHYAAWDAKWSWLFICLYLNKTVYLDVSLCPYYYEWDVKFSVNYYYFVKLDDLIVKNEFSRHIYCFCVCVAGLELALRWFFMLSVSYNTVVPSQKITKCIHSKWLSCILNLFQVVTVDQQITTKAHYNSLMIGLWSNVIIVNIVGVIILSFNLRNQPFKYLVFRG